MDLKIKKAKELVGARDSMDAPNANIDWFYYRNLPYAVPCDLSKEQLLFLINELNQENINLEKRVNDLEIEVTMLNDQISDIKWHLDLD